MTWIWDSPCFRRGGGGCSSMASTKELVWVLYGIHTVLDSITVFF